MAEGIRTVQAAIAAVGIALALAGWWWLAHDLPDYVLPGPWDALRAAWAIFTQPELAWHMLVSLVRVCLSVAVAMAIALVLAGLAIRFRFLAPIVEQRILVFFNSFPSVGWAVLGVIWFQISTSTVIFVQVAIILPFCIVNALAGFRQIDPDLFELGRSLTRRPLRRFMRLTLPLAMPFLAAGLRIAYGLCWKIALVAELFGARSGLGYLLMQAQQVADASMVFGTCLAIVIIYIATDWLVMRKIVAYFSANRGSEALGEPVAGHRAEH